MFTELQVIIVPIFIGLVCPLVSYIIYRYGRTSLASPSFEDKMELLYSYTAAGMLGKFLFFSLPNATGPQHTVQDAFVSGFVMVGFFIMLCVQKYNRVWYDNPYYVGPSTASSMEIRNIINKDTLEIQEYYSADNLDDKDTANNRLILIDEVAELKKRRLLFYISFVILVATLIFEGFFFVFREPFTIGGSWAIVIFFAIDKIKETGTIFVIALHALVHTEKLWYAILTSVWTVALICSCIPMIVQLTWEQSFAVVTHVATQIFYSLSGGILFSIALYFVWIDRIKTDKCETIMRLIVFGVSAGVSWLCGVFI
jgi:hypothetical protein